MKTKKPRPGKAAPAAARALGRGGRGPSKAPRREDGLAKAKPAGGVKTRQTKAMAQRRTRAAAKSAKASNSRIEKSRKAPPADQPPGAEPALKLPPILLEGDEPGPPPATGPGRKFSLGSASLAQVGSGPAGLPEAYGTGRLLLTARDPHWLYTHWDLARQQQRQYNALSADRHLVVRLFVDTREAPPVREIHVHPESRHWFIHVDLAETRYVAELGYYDPRRQWVAVAASAPAATPPETASSDQRVRFATIPVQVRLGKLAPLGAPLGSAALPPRPAGQAPDQAEFVGQPPAGPGQESHPGVQESARVLEALAVSAAEASSPAPLGGESEYVSSPIPRAGQAPKGFWLSVKADRIIHGATEPTASVTIGGEPVPVRPDGAFSCRLALPDGNHSITVTAVSEEGETRHAEVMVSRRTEHASDAAPATQDVAKLDFGL